MLVMPFAKYCIPFFYLVFGMNLAHRGNINKWTKIFICILLVSKIVNILFVMV